MTFDILCQQLRDLSKTAAEAGFDRLATELDVVLVRVRDKRKFYDKDDPEIKIDSRPQNQ